MQRDELKAQLDLSDRETERVTYLLSAVKDYCTDNMEKDPDTLKIILSISNQLVSNEI